MAELIASGTTEVASADFTLTGGSTTLYLKGAQPLGTAQIQIKSGTAYTTVGVLTAAEPAKVLTATGTFRVLKSGSVAAMGVDRD